MKEHPKNSLFYWYPKIKDLGIPMPETVMVPFPEEFNYFSIFDGKYNEAFNNYVDTVIQAHEDSGFGLPVFLRTGETSNKHGWNETCYVTEIDQIDKHIYQLLEFTEMAGWLGGLNVSGVVLRRFLELDKRFTAFHGRMPVAKEFRFFVKDGKLQCWHPYWFPACMVRPSIENWFDILMDMEKLDELNLDMLTVWAELIGQTVGGYWSIDFCKLKDESWAMTDMAIGESSFHWSACEHAPEEMKRYDDPYATPEGYKATIYSDTKKTKNPCMTCRHAEFDEDDKPYCIVSEPVECTENVESCESYDPISIRSDIKRRTEEEKVCDEDCANCPVRYECPDSPYEHSIENTEKRIEP